MSSFIKNLKTPIAIVGMGKSGDAAKSLLIEAGVTTSDILTFDAKPGAADFQSPELLMQRRPLTLVVSPGVPLSSPWLVDAQNQGIKITSELSLACSCLTTEKLMGVTGSVGKSTTVSILGAGLEAFSSTGFVGGNLGVPFSQYALQVLRGERSRADWIVLELSSYQLENCENLWLEFSAITFLTPNHLERYSSLEDYYKTKWNILARTRQKMFLNSAGGDLKEYARRSNDDSRFHLVSKNDGGLRKFELEKAELIGSHNQDNLALAATMAEAAGWPPSAVEGMKAFKGLAHRLENLGLTKNIRFINDSKATAMDSVLIAAHAAHETLHEKGHLILLLGGRNKSLPWENLSSLRKLSRVRFIFFGECRQIAQEKSNLPGPSYTQLGPALDEALRQAQSHDTVLLSPGGTSLDEFKSFEERGDFFKKRVADFAKS